MILLDMPVLPNNSPPITSGLPLRRLPAFELLPSIVLVEMAVYADCHVSIPFQTRDAKYSESPSRRAIWKSFRLDLLTQRARVMADDMSDRGTKRSREEALGAGEERNVKPTWRAMVAKIFSLMLSVESVGWENEGIEATLARLGR